MKNAGSDAGRKLRRKRPIAKILLVAGMATALLVATGSRWMQESSHTLSFDLESLQRSETRISSAGLRGRVVLVNVWASWCLACRGEHDLLLGISRMREADVIGLNFRDRRDDALRWLAFYGDPFVTNAFDPEGHAGASIGVDVLPQTLVIDRKGLIRHRHVGPLGRRDLDEVILPLMRELSADRA